MQPRLTPPTKALYISVDKRTGTLFMANAPQARLQMADGACYIQPHSTATSTRAGSGSAHRLMCIVATAWASQNRGAVALAACSARRAAVEHSARRNMTWHSNAS
jgi:hypothetical protein